MSKDNKTTSSSLLIENGFAVGMSYILKDVSGKVIDQASKKQPLYYLHGVGQIVPGLERELVGLKIGDTKSVTVEPKDGYGEINPELRMTFPKSQFPADQDLKPGMQFFAELGQERHLLTIKAVRAEEVDVDGNHPLSGQTLSFEIEVVEIRKATDEEMAHGHIHGPGGAHH